MTKRAVTYARVSSDDRNKGGLNLSGQLELCRAYALKKGYTVVAELAEDERGVSGALLESPALTQALEMASRHEFDILIVREIDRFARSLAKQLIVEQEFHKLGIELEFALESFDNSPEGGLQKNIKAVIAEFERVKINERTRRGRHQKVRAGNVLVHGQPPFGYRQQNRDGKIALAIHESEARIVRLIFNWFVLGEENTPPLSSRKIAKRLCEENIPAPSEREGVSRGWSRSTIQQILKNETYAGVWHYGKFANKDGKRVSHPQHRWLPLQSPAIITPEIWKMAGKRRGENFRRSPRNARHQYLLHDHVTCTVCGSRMATRSGDGRKRSLYYFCPAARKKSAQCTNKRFYRAGYIDNAIWAWLKNLLSDPMVAESGLEELIRQNQETVSPLQERMEIVKGLLDDYNDQLRKLADLYIDGNFSRDRLMARKKKLEGKIAGLANEYAQLTERLHASSFSPEQADLLKKFVQEIARRLDAADHNFHIRRKIVDFLQVNVGLSWQDRNAIAKVIFTLGETILTIEHNHKGKNNE